MSCPHLLSFDLEEYFHVEAARSVVECCQGSSLPQRLAEPLMRILQMLADHQASATFFVLGCVAQHERSLICRIAQAGHEIASHGMSHRMLGQLTPAQLRRELRESRQLLEDIAGRPVIGYRAPTFSITRRTAWALDVLAEEGFLYDSSVFPIRHDRYGVPNAPVLPHRARGPDGGCILEFPPLTVSMLGMNWPIGGGGYLRLLPVRLVDWAIRKAQRRDNCVLLYLHPWEFDPAQPILPMRPTDRWRHRVGLARTEQKLHWLLNRHDFTSVERFLQTKDHALPLTYAYPHSGST